MAQPRDPVDYGEYLHLRELLSSQAPKSAETGPPAHDEMLFIVVHQAYELWFKQILHELGSVMDLFRHDSVDERSVGVAVARLERVVEIQKILIDQLRVLETMTPLDFLEFRDLLVPASGFQSVQFRQLENRLGVRRGFRAPLEKTPAPAKITGAEREALRALRGGALPLRSRRALARAHALPRAARLPVLGAVRGGGGADAGGRPRHHRVQPHPIARRSARRSFGSWSAHRPASPPCSTRRPTSGSARPASGASPTAPPAPPSSSTSTATSPSCTCPSGMLRTLVDVDELLSTWRYRHALMVHRMIGTKIGTGGSSGHHYLLNTVERNKVFTDLFNLSTFLISRSALPALPADLERRLGFYFPRE